MPSSRAASHPFAVWSLDVVMTAPLLSSQICCGRYPFMLISRFLGSIRQGPASVWSYRSWSALQSS